MPDHVLERFEGLVLKAARRLHLAERGTLLAAVSGGADSLALMAVLARLRLKLEVATVDHGLRPSSAAEAEQVVAIAASLGLTAHVRRVSLDPGSGLEAAARDARYAALERVRDERGLGLVATGHTASDQAETVLLRLGRGAALGGAGGILERRADGVVRPLLGVTREETRAYVAALGLVPVEDPMNAEAAFARVRVRQQALPALSAALGPGTERALARFAALAHEDDELLQALARTAFDRAALGDGSLDRVVVANLQGPVQRRVLAMFLELAALPVDAAVIELCQQALLESGTATLGRDHLLRCGAGALRIEAAPKRSG
jgi:tRNA(Ile)-lysidine synthase